MIVRALSNIKLHVNSWQTLFKMFFSFFSEKGLGNSYSIFIQSMQRLGFNRSLLTRLLAEVHLFCWKTLAGSLIKILSIVFN